MTKDELLSGLPAKFHDDLTPEIHTLLIESKKTIIVLDDDPSGTNTVFDVPVLTDLSPDTIKDAIDEAPPVLFLLQLDAKPMAPAGTFLCQQNAFL